jgi:excisionase family DNA binding protein
VFLESFVTTTVKAENIAPESLLTSYQVGSLLQVNPSSVNKWVKDGRIPAFRTPGGHRRIRAADLVLFLQEHSMPVPKILNNAAKKRLLIVDDDPKQLSALKRLLKSYKERLEARYATNGIDALVQVGSFKPHVVLLDVYMAELDGIEVCRRLKDNPQTEDMKIIMVTGQVTPEIEKSALEAGAHECINKPINLEALLEKLALSSQSDAVSS